MPRDGKSTDGLSARWVKNLIAELKIRSIECNLLSLFKGLQKYRQKYILIWSTNNHGSYLMYFDQHFYKSLNLQKSTFST